MVKNKKVTEFEKAVAKAEEGKKTLQSYLIKHFADTVKGITVVPRYSWDEEPKYGLEVHFHRALTDVERNFLPVESQGVSVVGSTPSEEPGWDTVFGGTANLRI